MVSALDIAQYFISKDQDDEADGISNLKLQKLLYYAQGFHLALYRVPLFRENIEAWTHGPVVPFVYHRYKEFGRDPITQADPSAIDRLYAELDPERIDFLDEIYEVFGQFSAWKLRNMTHDEQPWLENEAHAGVIPMETMEEYFSTRIR